MRWIHGAALALAVIGCRKPAPASTPQEETRPGPDVVRVEEAPPPREARDGSGWAQVAPEACGFEGALPGVRSHGIADEVLGELCVAVRVPSGGLEAGRSYPMLVLLHGLGDVPASWWTLGGLGDRLSELDDAGGWPAIVVVPSGRDGYWTDAYDGQARWGDLVRRVVDEVGEHYPVSTRAQDRAIAGVSMGGFGALSHGLADGSAFGTVVGLSPTDLARAVRAEPKRPLYTGLVGSPPDRGVLAAINPVELARRGGGSGKRVLLVYGTAEPDKFAAGTRELAEVLQAQGAAVEVRAVPRGTHGWATTWTPETMRWWLEALAARW